MSAFLTSSTELKALVGGIGLVFVVFLFTYFERRTALFITVLGALTLAPFGLMTFGAVPDQYAVGIAGPVPTLTTYGVVLLAAGFVLLLGGFWRGRALLMLPLLLYIPIGLGLLWPHTPEVWSGALHYVTIVCAWVIGVNLGKTLDINDRNGRIFATAILAISVILGVTVLYQLATGTAADDRASGLFSHPATIGKIAVVMMALVLPLTQSVTPRTRRYSYISAALLLAMTGPTLSRANIIGIACVILIWAILLPGVRNRVRRLILPLVVALAFLPFLNLLLARFDTDEQGGARPELLAAGLRQIAANPLRGTGPNGYVSEVAVRESIVALTGYPVHDSLLLAVAELGIIGASLLLVPIVVCIVVAFRTFRVAGQQGDFARAALAMIFGICFVGATGWGVLQQPVAQLLFLILGISLGRMSAKAPDIPFTPVASSAEPDPRKQTEVR